MADEYSAVYSGQETLEWLQIGTETPGRSLFKVSLSWDYKVDANGEGTITSKSLTGSGTISRSGSGSTPTSYSCNGVPSSIFALQPDGSSGLFGGWGLPKNSEFIALFSYPGVPVQGQNGFQKLWNSTQHAGCDSSGEKDTGTRTIKASLHVYK